MRFAVWDHAGKGAYLRQRLLEAGHTGAETIDGCDLLLVDCDWAWAHPRPELISAASKAGAKVALFPHGGHPTIFIYDGLTEASPLVDVRLEHGQGSVEVAEMLGLELRQEACGWLYSPTHPFEPVDDPVRVLFAPQHPNMETLGSSNGHDPAPALNQKVYRDLLDLGYELTVTIVGPLWRNGVWPHPRARFVQNPQMAYQQSWTLVQAADVVVGAGTVAAAGVASGKPTVMLGQGNYADFIDGEYRWPNNHELYGDLLRYPLDVEDSDLDALIVRACLGDSGAAEWRARFIGDDGTAKAVAILEGLVGVQSGRVATIGGAMADKKADPKTPEPVEPKHVFIQGVPAKAGAKGKG